MPSHTRYHVDTIRLNCDWMRFARCCAVAKAGSSLLCSVLFAEVLVEGEPCVGGLFVGINGPARGSSVGKEEEEERSWKDEVLWRGTHCSIG